MNTILRIFGIALFCMTANSASADEAPDDRLPHATKLVRTGDHTYRVEMPYHVIRYGGGAPGKVYYSNLANQNKICRNLVLSKPFQEIVKLNGRYVKDTTQIAEQKLPGRFSSAWYYIQDFAGHQEDYQVYSQKPNFALHHAIAAIECEVESEK